MKRSVIRGTTYSTRRNWQYAIHQKLFQRKINGLFTSSVKPDERNGIHRRGAYPLLHVFGLSALDRINCKGPSVDTLMTSRRYVRKGFHPCLAHRCTK